MTAKKKSTSKAKSPTPATKSGKAAKTKVEAAASETIVPTPTASAPVTATASTATVAPVTSAPPVPAAPAVPRAVAAVASKPLVTTITARYDVGFGNSLYIRGQGAGLSWQRGVQMTCVSANEWLITLPESSRPVVFKFLINDVTWNTGQDYSAIPGTSTLLNPNF